MTFISAPDQTFSPQLPSALQQLPRRVTPHVTGSSITSKWPCRLPALALPSFTPPTAPRCAVRYCSSECAQPLLRCARPRDLNQALAPHLHGHAVPTHAPLHWRRTLRQSNPERVNSDLMQGPKLWGRRGTRRQSGSGLRVEKRCCCMARAEPGL